MRTENLIPPIDHDDKPYGTGKTSGPTERMCEGGIGREVGFDRCRLDGWRTGAEGLDEVGYFGHYMEVSKSSKSCSPYGEVRTRVIHCQ